MVHPAPHFRKEQQRKVESGQPSRQNAQPTGTQHKATDIGPAHRRSGQNPRRHECNAVAARAGIRQSLAHQSPLTHFTGNMPKVVKPSLPVPRSTATQTKNESSKTKHAPLRTRTSDMRPSRQRFDTRKTILVTPIRRGVIEGDSRLRPVLPPEARWKGPTPGDSRSIPIETTRARRYTRRIYANPSPPSGKSHLNRHPLSRVVVKFPLNRHAGKISPDGRKIPAAGRKIFRPPPPDFRCEGARAHTENIQHAE